MFLHDSSFKETLSVVFNHMLTNTNIVYWIINFKDFLVVQYLFNSKTDINTCRLRY